MDNEATREIQKIDKLIHEPARLAIMSVLYAFSEADFLYLLSATGLSKGNLSAHVGKLEEAGMLRLRKSLLGKSQKLFID